MNKLKITLDGLKKTLTKLSHKIFDDGKPYNLNIVGIRAVPGKPNVFDDLECVFYKDENGKEYFFVCNITTEPGKYYLNNPEKVDGTFVLAEGQHINCWKLGLHKGQWEALVQCGPMTGYRDNDKDDIAEELGKLVTGIFGINNHRANPNGTTPSTFVEKWSAGCQVVADADDEDEIVRMAKKSNLYRANLFSYTLIKETDLV